MIEVGELSPEELRHRLENGDPPLILDVREPEEVALAAFPGATHIPMGEIAAQAAKLDPERETVVVCHHGIRSAHVAIHLARNGFTRVLNLSGGIDAWARDVDPSMLRY